MAVAAACVPANPMGFAGSGVLVGEAGATGGVGVGGGVDVVVGKIAASNVAVKD